VNIIVMDTNNVRYAGAEVLLQPDKFNYNECLNIGAGFGNADLICFANNDILFPIDFIAEVKRQMQGYDVMSFKNQHGFIHPDIISGFCFVMTRKAWLHIGKLDASYEFWCADNVVSEQIKKHGLKELKSNISVHHICSVSHKLVMPKILEEYKAGCVKRFNRDYNQNVLNMGR
jgi:hypothetical protein